MKSAFGKVILLLLVTIAAVSSLQAQSGPPSIFFTDITSGPNTGGESVSGFAGAYVTIYGNNFGTSQGSSTVTLAGANCLRVVTWGTSWLWYQKIVVQLGSSCATGDFQITVGGQTSVTPGTVVHSSTIDAALFTVRSGHIFCVSQSGNDSNAGTFSGGCWVNMYHAVHTMAAGDITYVENGVSASGQDPVATYNAVLSIMSAGTTSNPIALVAYPGATVTISTTWSYGIRTPAVAGPGPNWVIAGLHISTTAVGGEAMSLHQTQFREVANVTACPNGTGTAACWEFESDGTSLAHQVYGNQITQAGTTGSSQKTYHGFYFSLSANHVDVGWNDIHNVQGCRGIQWYDEGVDMYDIHVHDNLIHDTTCDAINLNGINPNAGPVEVFNNVMYNVGKGPDPSDGAAIYSCVNLEANGTYTSTVEIYNNICYNAGFAGTSNPSQNGAFSLYVPAHLRNNIVWQANGLPYLTTDASCTRVNSGSSNNDWFGTGAAPTCSGNITASMNVNPAFNSTSTPDFHLQASSPMIGAGSTTEFPRLDHDGLVRSTPPSIGAYEFLSGIVSTAPKPNPPTNLTVTVQ